MTPSVHQPVQSSILRNPRGAPPTSRPVQTDRYSEWLSKRTFTTSYIIRSLGLGYSDASESPLELEDLSTTTPWNPADHNPTLGRDSRRSDTRLRKLERLAEQEEMKFSHSIQFNAVPDWSSNYISYSNLKKL